MIYSIGNGVMGFAAFLFGIFFDRFGLRITRIFLSIISTLGLLAWAFASRDYPWLVLVGAVLNGGVTSPITMVSCHAAELAGSKAGTILTLYTGLGDAAMGTYVSPYLYVVWVKRIYS